RDRPNLLTGLDRDAIHACWFAVWGSLDDEPLGRILSFHYRIPVCSREIVGGPTRLTFQRSSTVMRRFSVAMAGTATAKRMNANRNGMVKSPFETANRQRKLPGSCRRNPAAHAAGSPISRRNYFPRCPSKY